MPNWCSNQLSVEGPSADVEKFMAAASGRFGDQAVVLSFDSLLPTPADILAGPPEQVHRADLVHHADEDWRLGHWGCKWDLTPDDVEVVSDVTKGGYTGQT